MSWDASRPYRQVGGGEPSGVVGGGSPEAVSEQRIDALHQNLQRPGPSGAGGAAAGVEWRIRADWQQRPHALLTDTQLATAITRTERAHHQALAAQRAAQHRLHELDSAVSAGQGPALTRHEHDLAGLRAAAAAARQDLAAEAAVHAAAERYQYLTSQGVTVPVGMVGEVVLEFAVAELVADACLPSRAVSAPTGAPRSKVPT